ncbi:MAG TPA: EFR1 family ferrodoxin [Methanocella sp.]|jgi:flavodoxin/Pyruvate/2-oxoacid:ferredoxin oxidoreductase delta subunit
MKATIVYFSQTGNTEKVTYAMYDRLQAAGYTVTPLLYEDVADFPEALDNVDILGIGFPTFFGYPPEFFEQFLKGLRKVNGTDAFVFTTYGGATAGDSLYEAASVLKKKGYVILGGLKLEGSDSYPQGRVLGINAGRPDEGDLRAAAGFVDLILDAKKAGRSLDLEKLASPTPFFAAYHGKPHAALVKKMRKGIEGQILFNKEQCLFCETCKKSCPTRSIATGEKFPEFSWKCIDGLRCFQCARVCPGKALTVAYPGPVEDYRKFRDESADSPEEKRRIMITA